MSIVSKEEYWTTILNDYSQFDQITTEDSKFNSIANDVWNVLENSFIKIDDEESIIKWEEMTGLSGEGLTIFQRKVNILYTLTIKNYLPISLFTQAMDRLVGKGNYFITFNEETQKYKLVCHEDYKTSASFLNKRLANESVELEIIPLPSGYIAAEFLETESSAEIKLPLVFDVSVHGGLIIEQEHMSVDSQVTSSAGWADEGYGGINIGLLNGSVSCSRNGMGVGTSFAVPANEWFVHKWWFDGKSADIICYAPDGRSYKTSRVREGCTAYTLWVNRWKGKKRWFKAILDDVAVFDLIPAITPQGEPCMYNIYDKSVYKNTASKSTFVVGMTLGQARNLSKLPATGGMLVVALPSNYAEDEGVVNALATAQESGWVITIKTYEADAGAASTFALRRIWVRKCEEEQGNYIDADGTRWQVEWCVDIVGADPEQEGYELFRSIEAATKYWGLTVWVDPEQEELLINDFTKND